MAPESGRAAMRRAYGRAAGAWAAGAELLYAPLAEALVESSPVGLGGRRTLDLGAGTGAASRALLRRGAHPVGVDMAAEMLAHRRRTRPPSAAGDVLALPFRSGSLDGAVASFVLNHVEEPVAALAEMARVVGGGGVILASVFSAADRPALKEAIDEAARAVGWRPPDWYVSFWERSVPLLGSAGLMEEAARGAGLRRPVATERSIDPGLQPRQVARYRLSLAHLAPFVAALDPGQRDALMLRAEALVDAATERWAPAVVFLTAHA